MTRPREPSGYPDIVAEGPDGKWVIEVKGEDSGGYTSAEMNFQIGLGQIMCRMTDKNTQYGLAFPSTTDFKKVLRKYNGSDGLGCGCSWSTGMAGSSGTMPQDSLICLIADEPERALNVIGCGPMGVLHD